MKVFGITVKDNSPFWDEVKKQIEAKEGIDTWLTGEVRVNLAVDDIASLFGARLKKSKRYKEIVTKTPDGVEVRNRAE